MIVTVSNKYGSGALAIARRVAGVLEYDYVDQQLPIVVAKRLSIPEREVEASEDTGRTLGERLLSGLELATPELAVSSTAEPFDEELLHAVQDAVREYASRGDVVIVGRGSSVIVGARPDALRVFVHAPREWRIEHLIRASGADRKTVEREIDRIDRARTAYLADWYGIAFGDCGNYDLCIDTSCFNEEGASSLVVAAARAKGA